MAYIWRTIYFGIYEMTYIYAEIYEFFYMLHICAFRMGTTRRYTNPRFTLTANERGVVLHSVAFVSASVCSSITFESLIDLKKFTFLVYRYIRDVQLGSFSVSRPDPPNFRPDRTDRKLQKSWPDLARPDPTGGSIRPVYISEEWPGKVWVWRSLIGARSRSPDTIILARTIYKGRLSRQVARPKVTDPEWQTYA